MLHRRYRSLSHRRRKRKALSRFRLFSIRGKGSATHIGVQFVAPTIPHHTSQSRTFNLLSSSQGKDRRRDFGRRTCNTCTIRHDGRHLGDIMFGLDLSFSPFFFFFFSFHSVLFFFGEPKRMIPLLFIAIPPSLLLESFLLSLLFFFLLPSRKYGQTASSFSFLPDVLER